MYSFTQHETEYSNKLKILKSTVINDGYQFSSVQSLSRVQLFVIPWITVHQASLSITNSQSSPKPMSIESMMPSTISSSVVPFPSCSQYFPASGSFPMSRLLTVTHIGWPKYWSFIFSISLSNEYSGLISFSMDWLDLLAVQGLSRVFSAPQFKSILFGAQPLWPSSHIHTWLLDHMVQFFCAQLSF